MIVEYRGLATKQYNVQLVSRPALTSDKLLCLQFNVLLHRANYGFDFLIKIVYIGEPRPHKKIFERYIPHTKSSVSKWENVSVGVEVLKDKKILFMFEVIIPQGSQGFYTAVDDIGVKNGQCSQQNSCM